MTSIEARAEVFLTAFKSLKKAEREKVLQGLVSDKSIRRDLMDLATMAARSDEPSRPLRKFLQERARK